MYTTHTSTGRDSEQDDAMLDRRGAFREHKHLLATRSTNIVLKVDAMDGDIGLIHLTTFPPQSMWHPIACPIGLYVIVTAVQASAVSISARTGTSGAKSYLRNNSKYPAVSK